MARAIQGSVQRTAASSQQSDQQYPGERFHFVPFRRFNILNVVRKVDGVIFNISPDLLAVTPNDFEGSTLTVVRLH